jgi:streptomycin 6-kinase
VRAAKVLAGCTYGPETLKVIGRAFDGAWADIANHFAGDRDRADAARERLAHAVLIAAAEDSRDHQQIKNTALQIMALSYRGSWLDPDGKISSELAS